MGQPKERKPERDTNVLVISGRLTDDVEDRGSFAVFGLAVHTVQTVEGDRVEVPFFLRVKVFGKAAENCVEYLGKGRKVQINGGSLDVSTYEVRNDSDEILFYDEEQERPVIGKVVEVLTDDVKFLS